MECIKTAVVQLNEERNKMQEYSVYGGKKIHSQTR